MPGFDQIVVNLTRAAAANASSSGPTNLNASYTNNDSGNGDLGTKVGLGVGIPLGVLALGFLAWLFFRERRRRHGAGGVAAGVAAGGAYSNGDHPSPMEQRSDVASPAHTALSYVTYENGSAIQQQSYSPNVLKTTPYTGTGSPVYEAPMDNNVHEMIA